VVGLGIESPCLVYDPYASPSSFRSLGLRLWKFRGENRCGDLADKGVG